MVLLDVSGVLLCSLLFFYLLRRNPLLDFGLVSENAPGELDDVPGILRGVVTFVYAMVYSPKVSVVAALQIGVAMSHESLFFVELALFGCVVGGSFLFRLMDDSSRLAGSGDDVGFVKVVEKAADVVEKAADVGRKEAAVGEKEDELIVEDADEEEEEEEEEEETKPVVERAKAEAARLQQERIQERIARLNKKKS
mmetsp:Transcript_8614/g.13970  ORF Transcript_8614/g.13970 Transcript_8614/m.13970 type:complete len:196 (+) Transcript_8614:50-637(+)